MSQAKSLSSLQKKVHSSPGAWQLLAVLLLRVDVKELSVKKLHCSLLISLTVIAYCVLAVSLCLQWWLGFRKFSGQFLGSLPNSGILVWTFKPLWGGKKKKSTWKFQAESIYLFFELYFWFSIGLQPEDALKLENKGGKGIFLKISFLLRLVQKFQKDLACFLLYMQTMQQKPISEELPPHDIVYMIATLQSKTWNFQSRKNELFLC